MLALVHRHNSLELLAHICRLNVTGDPNTYKEYSSPLRPPYIEHLALLELKDANYETRSLEMPNSLVVEKAQSLLETIFYKTILYRVAESADPEREGPPSKLDELRFRQVLHELVVRSPTYYDHWCDVLRELFGSDYVVSSMIKDLGFDIASALKLLEAVPRLMERKLISRLEKALEHEESLRKIVDQFKKTGRYEGPEETRELANRIRNLRGKEAKRITKGMLAAWALFDLAETYSFTAPDIAAEAGVSTGVAEAFLKVFSIGFGSTDKNYVMPELTHGLKLRPVIRYDVKFFCPVPHLLLWAVKPTIESKFKADPRERGGSTTEVWQRYQKHRSDFLIGRGLDYFKRLLPKSSIYQGLRYGLASPDGEQQFELDGLVLFDRYAFFVEAKAGEFSDSARRGAPGRLVRDLKDLVAEPHAQAKRALQYVSSVDDPVFLLPDGSEVKFDKTKFVESLLVAIALDHFDVLTAAIFELREIGILELGELPWSVNLSDLRIIAETLTLPAQFTHYLKWRLHLNLSGEIYGHEELNWLGVYFAEGPRLLAVPRGSDRLDFMSYLTEFDDYYLYVMGERTKPAPRPSQYMPSEVRSLLDALEVLGGYGYSRPGEVVLDLDFKERDKLATAITKWVYSFGKTLRTEEVVRFGKLAVELRPFACIFEECEKGAAELAATQGCDAVVFSVGAIEPLRLEAWGFSRKPT